MKNIRSSSIHTLELGQMENFVYLIQDHSSKKVAVVDPAWEVPKVIALAQHQGFQITDVLLTHSHYDHTNGLNELLNIYDAQVHLLEIEAQFWGQQLRNPNLHKDGDIISIGDTKITVLHTPGHTPGSACYSLDGHLMTGDTLFVYGCGRCDLDGSDPEQMYHSLERLATLISNQTVIHPGHHYAKKPSSTLAEQLDGNPFMHFDNKEDFIRYRMYDHNRETPYSPVKTPLKRKFGLSRMAKKVFKHLSS
jgi:hydroxyacylglutathione hydrolase